MGGLLLLLSTLIIPTLRHSNVACWTIGDLPATLDYQRVKQELSTNYSLIIHEDCPNLIRIDSRYQMNYPGKMLVHQMNYANSPTEALDHPP